MTDKKEEARAFIEGMVEAAEENEELSQALGLGDQGGIDIPPVRIEGESELEMSNQLVYEVLEVLIENDEEVARKFMNVMMGNEEHRLTRQTGSFLGPRTKEGKSGQNDR